MPPVLRRGQPTKRPWRVPTLYATATAVATMYTFCVRLRYVSVAYIILCTPRITIPPMSFSLVMPNPYCMNPLDPLGLIFMNHAKQGCQTRTGTI
jgi:hypothetical protein